jgi:hypothetical protein
MKYTKHFQSNHGCEFYFKEMFVWIGVFFLEKVCANINAILIADDPKTFVTRRISEANLEFGGIRGDRRCIPGEQRF